MLLWLYEYIKQCRCCHSFEKDERPMIENPFGFGRREGIKVSLVCLKCGYHKTFWKQDCAVLACGIDGQYKDPLIFLNQSLLN